MLVAVVKDQIPGDLTEATSALPPTPTTPRAALQPFSVVWHF